MILTSLSRHIAHLLDHQTLARVGGGAAEFSACYKCGGGSRADKTCCDNPDDATCCKGKCKTVHNYYQWVAYILVLQVIGTETNHYKDLISSWRIRLSLCFWTLFSGCLTTQAWIKNSYMSWIFVTALKRIHHFKIMSHYFSGGPFSPAPPALDHLGGGPRERHGQGNQRKQVGNIWI